MASQAKAGASRQRSYRDVLKPFHSSIAQWRGEGISLREIADRLERTAGLVVDHNAIGRYCKDENILIEPAKKLPPSRKTMTPKRPSTTMDIAGSLYEKPASTVRAAERPPSNGGRTADAVSAETMAVPPPAPVAPQPAPKLPEAADSQGSPPSNATEIAHEQAPRTERANKQVTSVVPEPSDANKHPCEQTSKAAPATPPAAVPRQRWEELEGFIHAELPKLMKLYNNPKQFREGIAQITGWMEEAATIVPPERQSVYRDTVASLRKWVDTNSPEQLKKRNLLQRVTGWLAWRTEAARLDKDFGNGKPQLFEHKPPPPITPPPEPPIAASTEPQNSLFVPLKSVPIWTPDLELMAFNGGADTWRLNDACQGVLVLGQSGSGKTSGSGQALAETYLNHGFGGLVLTAKESECGLWQHYAERTGRSEQLCIVRPGGKFRFNFLGYQAGLPDDQGGSTEDVVDLFHSIIEAKNKGKPPVSDRYWEDAATQIARNAVRIFRGAKAQFTLDALREFMIEAPNDKEEAETGQWQQTPLFGKLVAEAQRRTKDTPEHVSVDEARRYWIREYPAIPLKTRAGIVSHLTSLLDVFFDPTIWDLFCTETTITPQAVFDGAIILLDLPTERFESVGRIAAIIWKRFFQMAVRRRNDPDDSRRRPVFLWADEAQNFYSEHDSNFQATARSARCSTVYLSQTISAFQTMAGGGEIGKQHVNAFMGNLVTKIFHAQNDPETNRWSAEIIGRGTKYRATLQHGGEEHQGGQRVSNSETIDFLVQPAEFMNLRSGGIHPDHPEDDLKVDAIVVKTGAKFSTGKHYFTTTFQQEKKL
jgi:hypothetical protein